MFKVMKKEWTYKQIAQATGCSLAVISRYFNKKAIASKNQQKLDVFFSQNLEMFRFFTGKRKIHGNCFLISALFKNYQNYEVIKGLHENLLQTKLFLHQMQTEDTENFLAVFENLTKINYNYLIIFYSPLLFNNPIVVKKLLKIRQKVLIYGKQIDGFQSFYVSEQIGICNLLSKLSKKFQKISYVGVSPKYESHDQNLYAERFWGIEQWNQNEQQKVSVFLSFNNQFENVLQTLRDCLLEEPDLIICGTHTIFRASSHLPKNKTEFTDIGYFSLNNYHANYYAKILINYNTIGAKMADCINKQCKHNYDLIPEIIFKKKQDY